MKNGGRGKGEDPKLELLCLSSQDTLVPRLRAAAGKKSERWLCRFSGHKEGHSERAEESLD